MARRRSPSIHYVKRQLKSGTHPTKFGAKYLDEGCFKKAYRLGPWVIKTHTDFDSPPRFPRVLKKYNIHPPRQYFVKDTPTGDWIVQPFYKPIRKKADRERLDEFTDNSKHGWHDIKTQNCGLDERGRVVAFDW